MLYLAVFSMILACKRCNGCYYSWQCALVAGGSDKTRRRNGENSKPWISFKNAPRAHRCTARIVGRSIGEALIWSLSNARQHCDVYLCVLSYSNLRACRRVYCVYWMADDRYRSHKYPCRLYIDTQVSMSNLFPKLQSYSFVRDSLASCIELVGTTQFSGATARLSKIQAGVGYFFHLQSNRGARCKLMDSP